MLCPTHLNDEEDDRLRRIIDSRIGTFKDTSLRWRSCGACTGSTGHSGRHHIGYKLRDCRHAAKLLEEAEEEESKYTLRIDERQLFLENPNCAAR